MRMPSVNYEQGPSSSYGQKVGQTEAEERGSVWILLGSKTEAIITKDFNNIKILC